MRNDIAHCIILVSQSRRERTFQGDMPWPQALLPPRRLLSKPFLYQPQTPCMECVGFGFVETIPPIIYDAALLSLVKLLALVYRLIATRTSIRVTFMFSIHHISPQLGPSVPLLLPLILRQFLLLRSDAVQ